MATNPVMTEWRWLNVRPLPVRGIQLFASYIFYFCANPPPGTAPGRCGKVFFAKLQRAFAKVMAEAGGKVGLGTETGGLGNLRHRQAGLGQKPFRLFQANAANFLGRRTLQHLHELPFQAATRSSGMTRDSGNANRGLCGVLADKAQGFYQNRITQGDGLRRLPDDNA